LRTREGLTSRCPSCRRVGAVVSVERGERDLSILNRRTFTHSLRVSLGELL
jgi:hypothetical protein